MARIETCKKCGEYGNHSVKFEPFDPKKPAESTERLIITCRVCGYSRIESCLDVS